MLTQASEALKFRVSFETICDLLATYSTEQLRFCLHQRVLLLSDGTLASCATTRLKDIFACNSWFDEKDFHAGLLRCRRDALLHFATLDLSERDYMASAKSRFATCQLVVLVFLAGGFATSFLLLPFTYFFMVASLGFSLFFFTLVMMRLVCLLALKKAFNT